jgi:hypothetical protein
VSAIARGGCTVNVVVLVAMVLEATLLGVQALPTSSNSTVMVVGFPPAAWAVIGEAALADSVSDDCPLVKTLQDAAAVGFATMPTKPLGTDAAPLTTHHSYRFGAVTGNRPSPPSARYVGTAQAGPGQLITP